MKRHFIQNKGFSVPFMGVMTMTLFIGTDSNGDIAGTKINPRLQLKPNVILIMTDDQGYGDLACNGNPVIRTPNLDRLKAESISFSNFHVDPYCAPTRAALMTGRYSHRTGGWGTIAGRNMLRDDEITMADIFHFNGYKTALSGKWHLGSNYPYRPVDRGFDEWLGKGDGGTGCATDYWGNDRVNDVYIHNGENINIPGYETDVFFRFAQEFIKNNRQDPFFLLLTPFAPHSPESVPDTSWLKPYSSKVSPAVADLYATIGNIDDNIGKLREFLRNEGLEENTILIFLTDNGSSQNPFPAGMRGRKGSQYEGGHRVPLFIHWPAVKMRAPREINDLTAHLDLLPTFIDLCSLDLPAKIAFDGTSLGPLLKGIKNKFKDRMLVTGAVYNFVPLPRPKWETTAVMQSHWRLVDGKELYDLTSDPGQQVNIAEKNPRKVENLRAFYEKYWKDVSADSEKWLSTLGRPIAGSQFQPELTLTCEDWISDDKNIPWNQHLVSLGKETFGLWRIRIESQGTYRVELRRWPREADAAISGIPDLSAKTADAWLKGNPVNELLYTSYSNQPLSMKALPVAEIRLKVAGNEISGKVEELQTEVVFKLELPAGEIELEAVMFDHAAKPLGGACYAYITKVNSTSD